MCGKYIKLLILFFILLHYSRPDRSAEKRFAKLFEIGFSEKYLKNVMILPWIPFESPKFKFKFNSEYQDAIRGELINSGYTNWTLGSYQSGSLFIGGTPADKIEYASKINQYGAEVVFVIDLDRSFLYAVYD